MFFSNSSLSNGHRDPPQWKQSWHISVVDDSHFKIKNNKNNYNNNLSKGFGYNGSKKRCTTDATNGFLLFDDINVAQCGSYVSLTLGERQKTMASRSFTASFLTKVREITVCEIIERVSVVMD